MTARPRLAALAAVPFLLLAAGAHADPAGKTTLEQTLAPSGGAYSTLAPAKGEKYTVRRGGSAKAARKRAARRRSLLDFAQLTDPQIADEMSPARVDFADPAGGELKSSWRPQEALGLQNFDSTVRNVNGNRRSPVKQGNGKKARLAFAITTGDLADNQQLNETRWFKTVLNGGTVDPFSGVPVTTQCGNQPADTIAKVNADVAARNYTGVADYDDYRDAPADRFAGFYDPDEASPTAGPYSAFPRYPGLLDAAQRPVQAAGLDMPWYISRGNHDGLVQGNAPASEDLFRTIATGCLKVFPNSAFDPKRFEGASDDELFASFGDPAFIQQLLAGAKTVAPDPDRRVNSKREYRALVGNSKRHGFGYTPKAQLRKSAGTASYYAFSPEKGFRFISLDTVAEGGGQSGNVDHPQYRWLRGELRTARHENEIVIAFGHHTLGTMTNTRTDERAGKCDPADEPGCDRDPRRSRPLHRGLAGRQSIRALLVGYPNVIAYVSGHTHANRVDFFKGRRGAGFWEINTASHIDWPEQSRTIEVMDNRDGTLSFNDPQREGLEGSQGDAEKRGRRTDRNVELLVRDPRGK